jgi:hypothetical protein
MPLPRTRVAAVAVLAATAGTAADFVAFAQSDTAIAEQLFRDGRQLMESGQVDQACEKFSSSQRLAPAIGTQLNLGLCREKQGRTATAWSLFADVEAAAQRNGDAARARIAHDHETALAAQLKKVVIEVPQPPQGMVVELDGSALPPGALGTEIPVDPGDHRLVVTAPGKKRWEQAKLSLGPSATTVHVRVELQDDAPVPVSAAPASSATPEPDAATTASSGAPSSPSAAPVQAEPPPSGPTTKMITGIAIGGAGVVALGVASYYGLTAIARKNDEGKYPVGSQDRLTVYDQASTAQTWGFVFGGVGVAALGVGIYLVLTSHAPATPAASAASWRVLPAVGPGTRGAMFESSF